MNGCFLVFWLVILKMSKHVICVFLVLKLIFYFFLGLEYVNSNIHPWLVEHIIVLSLFRINGNEIFTIRLSFKVYFSCISTFDEIEQDLSDIWVNLSKGLQKVFLKILTV